MKPVTVVAVGDTPTAVIAELEKNRGALQIVRRCPELAELLAACQNGMAQAAVIAQGADELSATLVDRLAAVGVSVVAVSPTPEAAQRLRGMGAVVVTEQVSAEMLGQVVSAAVQSRKQLDATGYAVPSRPLKDAAAQHRQVARDANPAPPESDTVHPPSTETAGLPATELGGKEAGTNELAADEQTEADVAAPTGRWQRTKSRLSRCARAEESGAGTTAGSGAGQDPDAEAQESPDSEQGPKSATQSLRRPQSTGARPSLATAAHSKPVLSRPSRSRAASRSNQIPTAGPPSGTGSTLVAVWGPIGSPGRTTIAINLAAEQAAAGRRVIVIDADSYGASIAAALGLLEESASFAQACRAADQGVLTAAQFAAIATKVVFSGGTFSLLTGLTRADRWPELRAAAVTRVLALARNAADLVVVDCGFSLENDEELSYDTVAPRRNAATLSVLGEADIIYAVGSGDPIGIPRLIRGMNELEQSFPAATVDVVVNKVRRKAAGRAPERALGQAWERFGPTQPIRYFLPWDLDVTDKALLEGRLLLEVAPESALRKAIARINCAAVQENLKIAVASTTAAH